MAAKTGRPKLKDPIKCQITVRLKHETMDRLDRYSKDHGITKGEAVRKGVEKLLEEK